MKTFGKWLWKGKQSKNKRGKVVFQVTCVCGKVSQILAYDLLKGKSRSCKPCSNLRRGGMNKDPLKRSTYIAWHDAVKRTSPGGKYFNRSIKMCSRWKNSFDEFLSDMGWKPATGYSIERVNNSRGYFPNNCKWALQSEQARNKSSNRWVKYKGDNLIAKDMADKYKIPYRTFCDRLDRGMSVKEAIETPIQRNDIVSSFLEKLKK